jgi:hypothetical protein
MRVLQLLKARMWICDWRNYDDLRSMVLRDMEADVAATGTSAVVAADFAEVPMPFVVPSTLRMVTRAHAGVHPTAIKRPSSARYDYGSHNPITIGTRRAAPCSESLLENASDVVVVVVVVGVRRLCIL